MAKHWKTPREEAAALDLIDEETVAKHRERMLSEVRAQRLADVRKTQQLTQVDVAKAMRVTQSRVSRLEKGEIEATELGTLRKYVEALGGHLRLVADFGEEHVRVG